MDDSADIRDLFVLLAEMNDFQVTVASNGEDGLKKFATLSEPPAIVFVDLNMPLMDGAEFVRRLNLRGFVGSSKIVFFSGAERDSLPSIDKCIRWLQKPFNLTDVMKLIAGARAH